MKRPLLALAAALTATGAALAAPRQAVPNLALALPPVCEADESSLGWDLVGAAGTRSAMVIARSAPLCRLVPEAARAALEGGMRGVWSGIVQAWAAATATSPSPRVTARSAT